MFFAARRGQEDDVVGVADEAEGGQFPHQAFVDGGVAHLPVAVPDQVADEREVQPVLQLTVEVLGGKQRLQVDLGEQLEPFGSMAHHLAAPTRIY